MGKKKKKKKKPSKQKCRFGNTCRFWKRDNCQFFHQHMYKFSKNHVVSEEKSFHQTEGSPGAATGFPEHHYNSGISDATDHRVTTPNLQKKGSGHLNAAAQKTYNNNHHTKSVKWTSYRKSLTIQSGLFTSPMPRMQQKLSSQRTEQFWGSM